MSIAINSNRLLFNYLWFFNAPRDTTFRTGSVLGSLLRNG